MGDTNVQGLRAAVIARRDLPTIPTVLTRILSLVERDTASGRELVDVVEHDQALTGKMLRLANSAFFGQSRRVSTVPRALVLLGFGTVRNLALGVKLWDTLATGISPRLAEQLWDHAVAVGIAAKTVVSRLRAGDPDVAFTAGLLHDSGRLAMAMRLRGRYWEAVGGADEIEAIERKESLAFGVDHAEVGGWLLEAWGLPTAIVETVRHHHPAVPGSGAAWVHAVVDRLVAWTDLSTGARRPEADQLLARMADRGLDGELWDEIVEQLREHAAAGARA